MELFLAASLGILGAAIGLSYWLEKRAEAQAQARRDAERVRRRRQGW